MKERLFTLIKYIFTHQTQFQIFKRLFSMFFQNLSVMGTYLKETFNATDEELAYLDELMKLRTIQRQQMTGSRHMYGIPSLVLDDFLYHGDFGHASNMKLLNEFGIRHIVNVSDCELEKEILENSRLTGKHL